MKVLIYCDVHFSTYSSIIRGQGEKYSKRLHNLISSLNWAEELAIKKGCDRIFCLGDFFNQENLNSEELTALQDINWANIPHLSIVGNHESSVKSLEYSSTKVLEKNNFKIIDTPTIDFCDEGKVKLIFLPYITEDDRKPLIEYINTPDYKLDSAEKEKIIVFSHNDVKGIRYGTFESKEGFNIGEIESDCDLFLNGHLHNGSKFCKNGYNLGNLSGQNFSEDATKYSHCVFILDTTTLKLDQYENPFAFNFYQIDINKKADLDIFNHLKPHSVISCRCEQSLVNDCKYIIDHSSLIEACRVIVTFNVINTLSTADTSTYTNTTDYLQQFKTFLVDKLGNTPELLDEVDNIINIKG